MAVRAFTGGDKLQAKLREIASQVSKASSVDVGFPSNTNPYPDGKPVAMVAAIQEFGAPAAGIPPRPFFRPMIAEKSPQWGETLGKLLVADGYDASVSLDKMGQGIAGQLQMSIINVNGPELSPATLLLRERFWTNPDEIKFADVQKARKDIASGKKPDVTGTQSKPLEWTGHMLNSVNYEVQS